MILLNYQNNYVKYLSYLLASMLQFFSALLIILEFLI